MTRPDASLEFADLQGSRSVYERKGAGERLNQPEDNRLSEGIALSAECTDASGDGIKIGIRDYGGDNFLEDSPDAKLWITCEACLEWDQVVILRDLLTFMLSLRGA